MWSYLALCYLPNAPPKCYNRKLWWEKRKQPFVQWLSMKRILLRQGLPGVKSTYLQSPAFWKFGYWEGYDDKVVAILALTHLDREKEKTIWSQWNLWQGSVEERSNENFGSSPKWRGIPLKRTHTTRKVENFLSRAQSTRILEKGRWRNGR